MSRIITRRRKTIYAGLAAALAAAGLGVAYHPA
jgi:hypothetical protein